MELKYLHTFQTIVDAGSFARAAEKLNYAQSAITFQMGQLENELGAKLFEKVGRRMALTQAGAQLLPYVRDVFASMDRLRCFEKELALCQGDLRIGVGETLLCYRFPAIVKAFHRRAPKARLFLRSMNCYEIRDALIAGDLDVGVFYEDVGGFGSSLTAVPFGRYSALLVASPEVARRYPDFITPDRSIPVPFIINEPNCIFRQMFEGYLRNRSILLDHTIELWSVPTIVNLVKSDAGVSFLPQFVVEKELSSGELVEIPTEMPQPHLSAVCAHHKNKWVSPLIQLFMDLCKEAAAQ